MIGNFFATPNLSILLDFIYLLHVWVNLDIKICSAKRPSLNQSTNNVHPANISDRMLMTFILYFVGINDILNEICYLTFNGIPLIFEKWDGIKNRSCVAPSFPGLLPRPKLQPYTLHKNIICSQNQHPSESDFSTLVITCPTRLVHKV